MSRTDNDRFADDHFYSVKLCDGKNIRPRLPFMIDILGHNFFSRKLAFWPSWQEQIDFSLHESLKNPCAKATMPKIRTSIKTFYKRQRHAPVQIHNISLHDRKKSYHKSGICNKYTCCWPNMIITARFGCAHFFSPVWTWSIDCMCQCRSQKKKKNMCGQRRSEGQGCFLLCLTRVLI